jgi:ABC-type branched-subunit amino acid transport system substrate-binding protein
VTEAWPTIDCHPRGPRKEHSSMRFVTTLLAAAALSPAFVPALAQAQAIKVGIANDISGPFAALGAEARDGFNLAIKQLGGKLGGQPASWRPTAATRRCSSWRPTTLRARMR